MLDAFMPISLNSATCFSRVFNGKNYEQERHAVDFESLFKWVNPRLKSRDDEIMQRNELNLIEIPILPFEDGVAFPTAEQPFHAILMNSRQMVNDIQRKDKRFGISMADSDGRLVEIGTMLRNVKLDMLDDGSQICWNLCEQRYRILEIIQLEPYIICRVEYPVVDYDILELQNCFKNVDEDMASLTPELRALELEVWNLFNKVTELTCQRAGLSTGLIEQSNYATVRELGPGNVMNKSDRLSIASDFSFAMSDMIGLTPIDRQILLSFNRLEDRLQYLKQMLRKKHRIHDRSLILAPVSTHLAVNFVPQHLAHSVCSFR